MAKFLLIHECHQDTLVSQLEARAETLEEHHEQHIEGLKDDGFMVAYDGWHNSAKQLAHMLENAETIELPVIYVLHDPETGMEVSLCAWSEEDAKERATEEWDYLDDPDWRCVATRGTAFPGFYSIREELGDMSSDEEKQELPF